MKRPRRRKASESKALLREAVVGGVLSTCCPAGIPIHKGKRINLPQSVESVQSKIYEVPARKRLIIEYVSFAYTAKVHGDHAVQRLRLGTIVGGELVLHDVQTILGSSDWSGGSHLVRIYADPRSPVLAIIDRVFRPRASSRVSFSGRLKSS